MTAETKRSCRTPGCEREPKRSGRDGQTLHAWCDACEERELREWLTPKEPTK